jgi:hypothetical protein
MAEVTLDVGFLDLCRGGETGAQRMAGKGKLALALGKIAANAGGEGGSLHQSRHMLIGQAFGADAAVLASDWAG